MVVRFFFADGQMAENSSDEDRTLSLKGFGVPATQVSAVTRRLALRPRLARGGAAFGAGLLAALLMLPIPIVHIIGPPLALLIGLGFGFRRLGEDEVFVSAEGSCPFCHTTQSLGLQGSGFHLPRSLICNACRQPLHLEAGTAAPPGGSSRG